MSRKKYSIGCILGIFLYIYTCIVCWHTGLPAAADSTASVALYDESNCLGAEEKNTCTARMQSAADTTGMHIAIIISTEKRSEAVIESIAEEVYDSVFGEKTDGICYYMDLSGYDAYDYISTSGLGQFYYTDSYSNNRIDRIYSAVDKYMYPVGNEDPAGAIQEFAEQLEYYYQQGIPEQYYIYDEDEHVYYHVENGILITTKGKPYLNWNTAFLAMAAAMGFGVLIAIFVYVAIRARYTFQYSLSPTNYVNKKTVVYRQQHDRFIQSRITKTQTSPDNRSHHNGSHHGGGGHSHHGHGGGGHHRH